MGSKKKEKKGSKKKEMVLERIIIHELIKERDSDKADSDLSKELCDDDSETKKLITILDKRYSKSDITYARFKTQPRKKPKAKTHNDDNKFKIAMDKYYKDQNDNSFIAFTTAVMKDLEESIKEISPAKGGYFVFADYEKYVGVFLIRNTEGVLFEKDEDDTSFKVNPAMHIDFNAMAMACRIDKKEYKNKKKRYLSFISRKNEPIAKYFIEWFSARDIEDRKRDTGNLVKIIKTISPPIDKKTKKPMPKKEFIASVYSDVKSNPQGKANLKSIGKKFYGNSQALIVHAKKEDIKTDTEIYVHERALKKIEIIIAKADEIELRFPTKYYKNVVTLHEELPGIITIDSLELANNIREQLGMAKRGDETKAGDKDESVVTPGPGKQFEEKIRISSCLTPERMR